MIQRQPISIRRAQDESGPYPMCPTCEFQGGEGGICDACDGGDEYRVHPEIEEEFLA